MSFFEFINISFFEHLGLSCYHKFDYFASLMASTLVPIGIAILLLVANMIHDAVRGGGDSDLERVNV